MSDIVLALLYHDPDLRLQPRKYDRREANMRHMPMLAAVAGNYALHVPMLRASPTRDIANYLLSLGD